MRVVTLHPGKGFEIVCTTEVVSLGSERGYEAISYVWGDPQKTVPITLDGQVYQVTTNLSVTLRNLRWETKARRLWIDSLCINQADVLERNTLIPKMRDIYAAADSVIVWLGPYGKRSVDDFHDCFKYAVARSNLVIDPEGPYATEDQAVVDSTPRGWEVLMEVLRRRWFERIWVVQEVAVRRRADRIEKVIFAVGNLRIPYAGLANGVIGMVEIPRLVSDTESGTVAEPNLLHRIDQAWHYRYMMLRGLSLPDLKRQYHPSEQLAFHLSRCANFKSTDPRDKLYALVGLLVGEDGWELPGELAPDYTQPVEEVRRAYTAWMLEESGSVDVLAMSSFTGLGSPSWIPDFEKMCGNFYTNSDELNGIPVKLSSDGLKLHGDALQVSSITGVGPRCEVQDTFKSNGDPGFSQESVARFIRLCGEYLRSCEQFIAQQAESVFKDENMTARGRLVEYLRRCIQMMPNRERWNLSCSTEELYESIVAGGMLSEEMNYSRWVFAKRLAEAFDGQPLLALDNGEFDYSYSKSTTPQPDDVVFLLRGSTKGFSLRDVGNGEWILIGVCNTTPDFARPFFSGADGAHDDDNLLRLSSEMWKERAHEVKRLIIR